MRTISRRAELAIDVRISGKRLLLPPAKGGGRVVPDVDWKRPKPLGRTETDTEGWAPLSASRPERLRDLALVQRRDVGHARWAGPSRNLDAARLQSLRHLALEVDEQEAVLEMSADHLDMLGKVEALPERPRRDAPVQDLGALLLLGVLVAGDEQGVLLLNELDLVG